MIEVMIAWNMTDETQNQYFTCENFKAREITSIAYDINRRGDGSYA